MNVKFQVGQIVECIWGLNKGKKFEIVLVLKDGYSCVLADSHSYKEKYFRYCDNTLKAS